MLLHNFAGRPSVAILAASHGYYMSCPPLISIKPEREKLLRRLPLEHICLETDSPSLGVNLRVCIDLVLNVNVITASNELIDF